MKKINVFVMIALLFSVFSLFSDEIPDEISDEIPDDIPDGYEFLFFDKCGNGIVEGDEVCDGGQIDCTELDVSGNVSTNSGFVSGIAACNSTCDGYVLDNCTAGNGGDGW